MEYTSLIFQGDKIIVYFASSLSDNSTSYRAAFSDRANRQHVGNSYAC